MFATYAISSWDVDVYSIEQRKQQQEQQQQLEQENHCVHHCYHTHTHRVYWICVQIWMQFIVTLRIKINTMHKLLFACTITKIDTLEVVDETANAKYRVEWAVAAHTYTCIIRIYYLDGWHIRNRQKSTQCVQLKWNLAQDQTVLYRVEREKHIYSIHCSTARNPTQTVRCACLSNYIIDFDISCTVKSQNGH